MLLKDYKKWWYPKMGNENRFANDSGNYFRQGPQTNRLPALVEYTADKDHVILVTTPSGELGLFYSANVVVKVKEILQGKLDVQIALVKHWRGKAEDFETAFNLQKSLIGNEKKNAQEYDEKIAILSDALARSKEENVKLQRKLNANRKRRIR